MKPVKYSRDKISIGYKGANIFASGKLALIITCGLALTLILFGVAAVENAKSSE